LNRAGKAQSGLSPPETAVLISPGEALLFRAQASSGGKAAAFHRQQVDARAATAI